MIVNDRLERTWKEAAVSQLGLAMLFRYCLSEGYSICHLCWYFINVFEDRLKTKMITCSKNFIYLNVLEIY
jgi:hypothetical protein